MASKYDEPLQDVMGLIAKKSSKNKILARAKEVKIEITKAWAEAQQAITFLDSMVNRYVPDKDWPQGFWFPPPPVIKAVQPSPFMVPRGVVTSSPISLVTRPQRIVEVANQLMTDGTVSTKSVIDQLRAEGDQRSEHSLAVSIGNVLNRHGWRRVEPGKYKLVEKQEGKEVK
jgi:hypothetical protein